MGVTTVLKCCVFLGKEVLNKVTNKELSVIKIISLGSVPLGTHFDLPVWLLLCLVTCNSDIEYLTLTSSGYICLSKYFHKL